MSALTLRPPESLHNRIKAPAQREGYSINQFLATAAVEKMAALLTVNSLREEAAQGGRVDPENLLKNVPNIEPADTGQIR